MNNKHFSRRITIFHGRQTPEEAVLVGYGAIIETLQLAVPLPFQLALISSKKRQYKNEQWQVYTSRHQPEDNLHKHLVFALKYEGINLLVFKKLFETISQKEIETIVQQEILGQYSRRIWFLYEWLLNKKLDIDDLNRGNPVPLIDENLQFAVKGISSPRHRIINNLPGTVDFCPLIFKTEKLNASIAANLSEQQNIFLKKVHKDLLQRASSFLLLKDSKASFTIEGENPPNARAARWGKAIGQAGGKPLSGEELNRLQQIVIENGRFIEMGFRKKGGFVGEHDRTTGEPIPEHISARWQDIDQLINGLLKTNELLEQDFDAVLAAAVVAFGFVFIHPFEDGNGRLHRYIIHHVLAKKKFTQQGVIFPVSASILDHINDYHSVLELYSHSLLDYIKWKETPDHNVEVLNETIDLYRYYDATKQAEFLYDCTADTINRIIPEEVNYLIQYDEFNKYINNNFEMPDKLVATLVRFLQQNNGVLSKRAKEKEFNGLTEKEADNIEKTFNEIFING
ncbi:MAG: Fic family protein [Saprospiraceae bacterium]|nr:Fic family protein [Candidatus Defluviibacterium haderslevense]